MWRLENIVGAVFSRYAVLKLIFVYQIWTSINFVIEKKLVEPFVEILIYGSSFPTSGFFGFCQNLEVLSTH